MPTVRWRLSAAAPVCPVRFAPASRIFALLLPLLMLCLGPSAVHAQDGERAAPKRLPVVSNPKLDRSGAVQRGHASYYGSEFFGRTMADGTPMDPDEAIAASRTLPLGTKVVVTNLENGKRITVEIRDRGPYIAGRIIDLTPKAARELGFHHEGLALVEVAPLEVPMPDGSIKLGAAADTILQAAND